MTKNRWYLIFCILVCAAIFLFIHVFTKPHFRITKLEKEDYKYAYEEIDKTKLQEMIDDKKSFIIYTYNAYCSFPVPCKDIFLNGAEELNVKLYGIPFNDSKSIIGLDYGPSVVIFNKGKRMTYLDPELDEDVDRFQKTDSFVEWIKVYVEIKEE